MEFEIRDSLDGIQADAIVVGLPEDADRSDPRFSATANPLFASGDLPLKPFETLVIPGAPRIVFIGVPKGADLEAWRRTAATVVRRMKKVRRLAFSFGDVRSIVEGALVGSFSVEAYKTSNNKSRLEKIIFAGTDRKPVDEGTVIGESINWARGLINEPSNRKPPRVIAERFSEMATSVGLAVNVLDERDLRDLKMGALLGVGQGSEESPRLVVSRHMGNPGSPETLAYVGKGITFDSG